MIISVKHSKKVQQYPDCSFGMYDSNKQVKAISKAKNSAQEHCNQRYQDQYNNRKQMESTNSRNTSNIRGTSLPQSAKQLPKEIRMSMQIASKLQPKAYQINHPAQSLTIPLSNHIFTIRNTSEYNQTKSTSVTSEDRFVKNLVHNYTLQSQEVIPTLLQQQSLSGRTEDCKKNITECPKTSYLDCENQLRLVKTNNVDKNSFPLMSSLLVQNKQLLEMSIQETNRNNIEADYNMERKIIVTKQKKDDFEECQNEFIEKMIKDQKLTKSVEAHQEIQQQDLITQIEKVTSCIMEKLSLGQDFVPPKCKLDTMQSFQTDQSLSVYQYRRNAQKLQKCQSDKDLLLEQINAKLTDIDQSIQQPERVSCSTNIQCDADKENIAHNIHKQTNEKSFFQRLEHDVKRRQHKNRQSKPECRRPTSLKKKEPTSATAKTTDRIIKVLKPFNFNNEHFIQEPIQPDVLKSLKGTLDQLQRQIEHKKQLFEQGKLNKKDNGTIKKMQKIQKIY